MGLALQTRVQLTFTLLLGDCGTGCHWHVNLYTTIGGVVQTRLCTDLRYPMAWGEQDVVVFQGLFAVKTMELEQPLNFSGLFGILSELTLDPQLH